MRCDDDRRMRTKETVHNQEPPFVLSHESKQTRVRIRAHQCVGKRLDLSPGIILDFTAAEMPYLDILFSPWNTLASKPFLKAAVKKGFIGSPVFALLRLEHARRVFIWSV